MGSEWPTVELSSCAEFQEGYVNPSQKKDFGYFGGPIKWLRATDLNNGFVHETSRTLTKLGFESAGTAAKLFEPNTIGISKSGTIGRVGILKDYMCGNRAVINVKVNDDKADTRFIFYILIHNHATLQILAIGSVQPNLYTSALGSLEFPLPPLPEQKAIAHILGTLDDKIELNRRMNATLEGMAQALFKSWFVDFDPVIDNALAAGNPIPDELAPRAEVRRQALANGTTQQGSLDHPTLSDPKSLFPAAFQFTEELGWIPEGWDVSTIDNECEIVGGGTPSTKNSDFWDDGEFPWVTPKDFSALQDKVLLSSSRFLTQAGLNKVSSGLLPKETVLMSSRAPVGYLAISKIETAINQGFIGMTCNKRLSPEFVLQWADSRMDDIKRAAGGSTFAEISKKAFRPFEIVVPSQAIVAAYTETAGAIYDKIADGVMASNTLTKLRDTLLPKLISGELRIPEAEQLTEEAVA